MFTLWFQYAAVSDYTVSFIFGFYVRSNGCAERRVYYFQLLSNKLPPNLNKNIKSLNLVDLYRSNSCRVHVIFKYTWNAHQKGHKISPNMVLKFFLKSYGWTSTSQYSTYSKCELRLECEHWWGCREECYLCSMNLPGAIPCGLKDKVGWHQLGENHICVQSEKKQVSLSCNNL